MTVKPKKSQKATHAPAPIWAEPAPGQRRPRHSREQIAAAALAIADREGFAAVSMRRVAEELGAATMTLYYYIRTKEDLVTLMDDALMTEVLVPDEALALPWREAIATIARKTREVFVRHPWALYELRGARQGPNTMRHVEQSLTAVADAPLSQEGKIELLGIIDDYVFGHALRHQMRWSAPDPDSPDDKAVHAFMADQLATGHYPRLAAMVGPIDRFDADDHPWARQDQTRAFERGLGAILDAAPGWAEPVVAAKTPKKKRSG